MATQETTEIPELEDAVEQLAEYFGLQAHYRFKVKGEIYTITYRQFLPADIQRKLGEVDKSLEDCDKVQITLPNRKKIDGQEYLIPLRRKGELIPDPPDALRLIAMWGEEKYRAFEAAGGSPEMLTVVWSKQDADYERWKKAGSKSDPGD